VEYGVRVTLTNIVFLYEKPKPWPEKNGMPGKRGG
jgi:hypothetical protein